MRSSRTKPPVGEAELHGYVDGELDRERQAAVRTHLSVSPEDSARVESWRRQNEAIRAAFPPVDPSKLPWPLLVLPEKAAGHGFHRLHESWLAYRVVLAFVSGAFLSGSMAFFASRLNLRDVSLPSPAAVMPAVANDSIVEQALASLGEFEAQAAGRSSQNVVQQGPRPAVPVMPALSDGGLKLAGIRSVPYGSRQMLCAYYATPGGGHIALCAGKADGPGESPGEFVAHLRVAPIFWRQSQADDVGSWP